jgi:hypothetical protein
MVKKKTPSEKLAGTVEGQALDFFEREKAAYEKRTGQKVEYAPPIPLTRTPVEDAAPADAPQSDMPGDTQSPAEENQSEGDK